MLGKSAKWILLALAWAIAASCACGAASAGDVRKVAAPRWVQDLPIPQARAERLREVHDGLYHLLYDTQVSVEGDVETFYYRKVYRITDRQGLEDGGRLEIEFDPSDQDVFLHQIRVLRDGVVRDRLRDAKVEILQREQDLENGVVTGLKTVHLEIGDVRVGDVVDIAFAWRMQRKIWVGQFFNDVSTSWSVPVGVFRYRLIWPAGRPLAMHPFATTVSPGITHDARQTTFEWMVRDPDPVPDEDGAPDWYQKWGHVALSSMTSWDEVVRATAPLYSEKMRLSPQLEQQADQIAARYADPADRITEALRLVQDRLRYVSLSIGKGSFIPRLPDDVFRSGYGDCKDKALLLAALLTRMGIDAAVALTDTAQGPILPQEPPAPTVFNHAITRVRLRGKSYWLEPTRSHEGGRFPDLAPVPYRWALPLVPGQTALEAIPPDLPSQPTFRTTEQFDLNDGNSAPLHLHVTTYYDGADADWMRANIADKSPSAIEQEYLKYYGDFYSGLLLAGPLKFTDDRDRNQIVTYESYALSAANLRRNGLLRKFEVKASSFSEYGKPDDGRKMPYALPFPINKRHTIVVKTPGHQPPAPQPYALDGVGFSYGLDVNRRGDTLTLAYRIVGKKQVIGPQDIARYRGDVDAMDDENYWYLDLASTEGGTIGDTNESSDIGVRGRNALAALIAMIVLGIGAIFGVRRGLHADDMYSRTAYFYPVDPKKFFAMHVATAGLYGFFWMWKCWRWAKVDRASDMLPFWRAFFGIFWFYPLFAEVNGRRKTSSLIRLVGIGAAALYLLVAIVADVVPYYRPHDMLWPLGHSVVAGVLFLPTVLSVNAINAPDGKARLLNSRWTLLTMVAMAYGIVGWAFIYWSSTNFTYPISLGH